MNEWKNSVWMVSNQKQVYIMHVTCLEKEEVQTRWFLEHIDLSLVDCIMHMKTRSKPSIRAYLYLRFCSLETFTLWRRAIVVSTSLQSICFRDRSLQNYKQILALQGRGIFMISISKKHEEFRMLQNYLQLLMKEVLLRYCIDFLISKALTLSFS